MNLADKFSPKDTQEIKPGLFIKKTKNGWRQVNPLAWKGKFRTREQLQTIFSLRTIFFIALIIFIAWSYQHDNEELIKFYKQVTENPIGYCEKVYANLVNEGCTLELEQQGLCLKEMNVRIQNPNGL